jgi:hypothetical protein
MRTPIPTKNRKKKDWRMYLSMTVVYGTEGSLSATMYL